MILYCKKYKKTFHDIDGYVIHGGRKVTSHYKINDDWLALVPLIKKAMLDRSE